jgi:hypothetical protein
MALSLNEESNVIIQRNNNFYPSLPLPLPHSQKRSGTAAESNRQDESICKLLCSPSAKARQAALLVAVDSCETTDQPTQRKLVHLSTSNAVLKSWSLYLKQVHIYIYTYIYICTCAGACGSVVVKALCYKT